MMVGSALTQLKTVWERWNIRAIVLLSLSLQVILILGAPLRKRSANTLLIFSLWSAYLLADWAAAFAVGHISVQQRYDKSGLNDNGALLAFWAPFLLVHLGGPDTMTAFSLEDNALWHRHLLNLITQTLASVYVFYQTPPENKLLIPTLLMLVAGVVKYGERILALYVASLKTFKKSLLREPDPGLNYAKLMERYASLKDAMLPASIKLVLGPNGESKMTDDEFKEGKLDEKDVVKYGHGFFEYFKGLIVDLTFTFHDHRRSQEFFQKRTAADALKVISTELNFVYEILYTKVSVVHSKWGYFFRLTASSMVVVTLVMFTRMEKHQYDIFDRIVTYALLYGAIGLDVIAILMLLISDWNVAYTIKRIPIHKKTPILDIIPFFNKLSHKYVSFMTRWSKPGFTTCQIERSQTNPPVIYQVLDTKIWSRRWSESIYAYNLLSVCLKLRPQKILKIKWHWRTVLVLLPVIICAFIIVWISIFIFLISIIILGFVLLIIELLIIIALLFITLLLAGFCFALIVVPLHLCGAKHIVKAGLEKAKKFFYPDEKPEDVLVSSDSEMSKWNTFISSAKEKWNTVTTWSTFTSSVVEKWDNFVWFAAEKWDTFIWSTAKKLGFEKALDSGLYLSRNPFLTKLWDFIYDELQVKSLFADDTKTAKQIYEAKGEWVLQDGEWLSVRDPKEMMEYVQGDYDRILLLWHIATELCYSTDKDMNTQNYAREFSKILSDYMLYLIIKQPTMMSNVAGISYMRFQDTCAEAKMFFRRKGTEENDKLRDACEKILGVETSAKPLELNGSRCKSVLFDGCRLAKMLKEREDMWKMMSRVWVELLSYAAGHCRAETHAQVLSKGGELVTLVWLLMAHLGIVERFQINDGHARAKLLLDA